MEEQVDEKKSYMTQLSIYMKQYNRLSEQIYQQEMDLEERERRMAEKEEDKLEQIFSFTVYNDFRGVLNITVLKEKISKNNIDMMVDTFRPCLVALTTKEMRLHEGTTDDTQYRGVRLHEIENVDYHTQPYIFTVFTITKDKTQGQEYLYFRFNTIDNQDKWDRAVFCNYMTRKMKKKSRYFEIDYPDKEHEKRDNDWERKVNDVEEAELEIDRAKIMRNIYSEREKEGTSKGTVGHNTERESPHTESKAILQRFNTDNHINTSHGKEENQYENLFSPKRSEKSKPFFESEKNPGKGLNQSYMNKSAAMDSIAEKDAKKDQGPDMHSETDSNAMRSRARTISKNFLNLEAVMMGGNSAVASEKNPSELSGGDPDSNILDSYRANSEGSLNRDKEGGRINPLTRRKVELKEKYEGGIVLMKEKFFENKAKIFYLCNSEFEYWDFKVKTGHKENKKAISFADISSYRIDSKKEALLLSLRKNSMTFYGKMQELNELVEWLELCWEEQKRRNIMSEVPQ